MRFKYKILSLVLILSLTAQMGYSFELNFFKKKKAKKENNVKEVVLETKDTNLADKSKKVFSIEQCVEYAINNDPSIKIAVNNLEVQKSRVGQAKSDYFPTLGAGTGYNYQYSNSANYSSSSMWRGGSANNSTGYYQLNASVNQLIWNFGKTTAGINMQKFNRESAGYDLDYNILTTVYNVKTAYFAVLAALANVDIYERSVRINSLNYERTKAMFEEGLKSRIDVVNAEVYLTDARTQLIDAQYKYDTALVNLKNSMFYMEDEDFLVENTENFDFLQKNYKTQTIEIGNIHKTDNKIENDEGVVLLTSGIQKQDILQNYKFDPYIIEIKEAIQSAYENRPDLKSLKMLVRAQEESLKQIKRTWAPEITGSAGYNLRRMDGKSNTGFTASANLDIPILNIMDIKYRIDEGKSYLKIAQDNVELSQKNINFEVQKYYIAMRRLEKTIPLMADKVRQTLENFELADGRYAVGLNNFIELQDAQTNYNNAQLAFVQSVFDYNVAREEFKKSMGVR